MTLLPILPSWLFWPLTVILLAGAIILLVRARSASRWRYAALVLLVVMAGARPGLPGGSAAVANSDLNVFFVVDTSASSGAGDYDGTKLRLAGMQDDINKMATELAGARFSLISFDSKAKVVLPLTTDATALRTLTEVMRPQASYSSQGSSISVAKDVLAERLEAAAKTHPERPRLVFYLGDGEQTAAQAPAPFTAGVQLIDGGAVLGYGTSGGAKMHDFSLGTDDPTGYIIDRSTPERSPAVSVIDEKSLRGIAGQLGVPYTHRVKPGDIAATLVDAAPKVSSSTSSEQAGKGRIEFFWIMAVGAFGLALWQLRDSGRALTQLRTVQKGER
ncbi:vWA domain-containing protein [Arthrobacter cryoconiti]|uniref:VWA domain-containing protein n=1 Tax=Arthrobacter cryoconiti TaxID=748907 RepID=A0ABV8R353_9MICC|nr:VWA domain-containing protein [Arthrobacter cryoconiti]MCC9068511.1 VWA domain-containing protein [Arthrobacter cryoconiti]